MVSSQAGSLAGLGTPRIGGPMLFIFTTDLDNGIESTSPSLLVAPHRVVR